MNKFNVKFSDSTHRVIAWLADRLEISMADVIREALSLYWWIAKERMEGNRLLVQRGAEITEMVVPSLEQLRQGPDFARELVPREITAPPATGPDRTHPRSAAAQG